MLPFIITPEPFTSSNGFAFVRAISVRNHYAEDPGDLFRVLRLRIRGPEGDVMTKEEVLCFHVCGARKNERKREINKTCGSECCDPIPGGDSQKKTREEEKTHIIGC